MAKESGVELSGIAGSGPNGRIIRRDVEGAMAFPMLPKAIEISFRDSPFELILQNQDLDALNKVSQDIANKIRGMNNLRNVNVGFEVNKPELRVSIDRSRAATLGVSIEDISRTMQILFGGLDLSRIKVGGKELAIDRRQIVVVFQSGLRHIH